MSNPAGWPLGQVGWRQYLNKRVAFLAPLLHTSHLLLQFNILILSIHIQLMSLQNHSILAVKAESTVPRTLSQYDTGRFKMHTLFLDSKRMGVKRETVIQILVLQIANAATTPQVWESDYH